MDIFEKFVPKTQKRSLFLSEEDNDSQERRHEEDIPKENVRENDSSSFLMKSLFLNNHPPPPDHLPKKKLKTVSLKDRVSSFISQFNNTASRASSSEVGTVAENVVVPATPRFQKSMIPFDEFKNWYQDSHPLWSKITIESTLEVDLFSQIAHFIATENFPKIFKFSSQSFQLLPSLLTTAVKATNNTENYGDKKQSVDEYRVLHPSLHLQNDETTYQLFYSHYEEALKDCTDTLFQCQRESSKLCFYLLYELPFFDKHSSNERNANHINLMKKLENEQAFSSCLYESSTNYPHSLCFITNLKPALYLKFINYPSIQYYLLEDDSDHPPTTQENAATMSSLGEYQQRLQGKSIVVIGEYSIKIWNYLFLEHIFMKLFSFSWLNLVLLPNTTRTASSNRSFHNHRERLSIFIPTIVSEVTVRHGVSHQLHFQLTSAAKEGDRQVCRAKFTGLITVEIIQAILTHFHSLHKNSNLRESNKFKQQQLQKLMSTLPPARKTTKKMETIQSSEMSSTQSRPADSRGASLIIEKNDAIFSKYRKSQAHIKLINPFTFAAVEAATSVSRNEEDASDDGEDDPWNSTGQSALAASSSSSYLRMRMDPTISKLNFLSSSSLAEFDSQNTVEYRMPPMESSNAKIMKELYLQFADDSCFLTILNESKAFYRIAQNKENN